MRKIKVLIIGAGPAGSSSAIQLLKAGHTVTLIDRAKFPRHAPGESLHPGIEPLLKQLGVYDKVLNKGFLRYEGIVNQKGNQSSFEHFNAEKNWEGFQLFREDFDAILLQQAIDLGAIFFEETNPISLNVDDTGNIKSIQTTRGLMKGNLFIDATGKRAWLAQQMNIPFQNYSPKSIAYYGYVRTNQAGKLTNPKIIWDKEGWTWLARVQQELLSWVRLDLKSHKKIDKNWLPQEIEGYESVGTRRAVDVTWRIAKKLSSSNYFLLGDAAFVLDPSSSHGVLKALMSGIMVAHLVNQESKIGFPKIHSAYKGWLMEWFDADVIKLKELYQKHSFIR